MHEEWSGISCRFPGSLFIFRYRQSSDLNAKQAWGLYPQNLWPTPLTENKNFRKIWKEKTPYQANRTNQLADPSRYIHPVYLVFGQAWRPRCNLSWPRVKWKVLASFICLLHYTQYISFKLISRAHKELCLCCRQLSNPSHNPETKFFCQIQCHLLGANLALNFSQGAECKLA